ncbi:hypothetical protein KQ310_03325 [Synechococcus sp. CS-1328]|nr:hypothetical protein [Synechococcus sp. CS-1328]
MASFQMGVARFLAHDSDPLGASSAFQAALAMLTATLFSVLDGAFDFLFTSMQAGVASAVLPVLYLLSWAVNLLCVVLALGSMETFLRLLQRSASQP